MSVLLFAAAGTMDYWQGWLFLVVFMGASLLIMLYLAKHDPALLRRRLAGGPMVEKEPQQKIIMVVVSIGFVGLPRANEANSGCDPKALAVERELVAP